MTGTYKRTKLQIYAKHKCMYITLNAQDYNDTGRQITISKIEAKQYKKAHTQLNEKENI